jgi:hypothetical protein
MMSDDYMHAVLCCFAQSALTGSKRTCGNSTVPPVSEVSYDSSQIKPLAQMPITPCLLCHCVCLQAVGVARRVQALPREVNPGVQERQNELERMRFAEQQRVMGQLQAQLAAQTALFQQLQQQQQQQQQAPVQSVNRSLSYPAPSQDASSPASLD